MRVLEQWVVDSDQDGVVVITFPLNISPVSVWAIADIKSGKYIVAASRGTPSVREIPGAAIRSPQSFALDADYLEFLYVSRDGAWRETVVDGGTRDIDGAPNGSAAVRVSAFRAIEGFTGAAPAHYRPGDLSFAIDPLSLQVFVVGVRP